MTFAAVRRDSKMTVGIAIVLGLLVVAMVLFGTELVPVDVTALGLICMLIATGTLTPAQAFSGFGDEVIIILASIMVLAGAIVKAGVMDRVGRWAFRVAGAGKRRAILVILGVSAVSSAFLSNTNTTAIMMPAAIETARRAKISASQILMPLAFAAMLGGSATLIGTSANLAGSAMVSRLGLEPFSLFEFMGVGAIVSFVGLVWLSFLGHYFIPARRPVEKDDRSEERRFFTTLCLPDESSAEDTAICDLDFDSLETDLLEVVREGARLAPHHSRKLRKGDELIVRSSTNGLLMLEKSSDFALEPGLHFSTRLAENTEPMIAEAVVTPQSRFVGHTLKQLDFFGKYRGIVIAVYRRRRNRAARIENLVLQAGDALLLRSSEDDLMALKSDPNIRILTQIDQTVLTPREGLLVFTAMTAAVLASATGLVPFSLSIVLAVLVVVISGSLTMSEAYRFIEWRLLVLIAAMSSFGLAMQQSGAASYLAAQIVAFSAPFGPVFAMACFSLLTVLLTQPMSNAAAALTLIPVAVSAAPGLGLDPRMLAILVTLSASLSFISPLEPACLLVYDSGRYRFLDYVRAGMPLTVISVIILLVLVPVIWS